MILPNRESDQATAARIFQDRILPDSGMERATSHANPKAIFLVGQPGAGKGVLIGMARADLANDLVMVDPDRLRSYHPNLHESRSARPYTWPLDTDRDAYEWAAALQAIAVQGRKNLIVDTALSDIDDVTEQLRALQAEGYEVEVRVVAAHRLESELSVDKRFLSGFLKDGHGLYHDEAFRTQAYERMPGSLDQLRSRTGIPILVFNSDGAGLYDSRTNAALPGAALEQARNARITDPKLTKVLNASARRQQELHRDLPRLLANMRSE